MNGIFANYLWTMFWGSVFWIFWIMWFFPRKYKYRCIRVYVWFKDDKHVIWMWIWLILKNISLLDRIWSLWLVRFAHSPTNFIFWLGRLIFSVSINSHPDNIYIADCVKGYHCRCACIIVHYNNYKYHRWNITPYKTNGIKDKANTVLTWTSRPGLKNVKTII